MKPTAKQKQAIRRHWAGYALKFKADGTVHARKAPGAAWGQLYAKADLEKHVSCLI